MASVKLCDGLTTQAFVGRSGSSCVASFMGTRDALAWITNLRFNKVDVPWEDCNQCRVHQGFLSEWQSLEPCIEQSLEDIGCPRGARVSLTGHSLGGAVATLAAMSLEVRGWHVAEAYTFGMPRTGDDNFARALTHQLRGRFFRVTHGLDPVPHLPPMPWLVLNMHYAHVEPEIFYEGNVSEGYAVCTEDGDKACAAKSSFIPELMLHIDDHRTYLDADTGTMGCDRSAVATVKRIFGHPADVATMPGRVRDALAQTDGSPASATPSLTTAGAMSPSTTAAVNAELPSASLQLRQKSLRVQLPQRAS
eukprot:TRINITY_DN39135_c0_g1_i2.p2 TRINITY_DN39135_c0_g1~~TRINITY_DN39135_c0_g1_i2.p2  ORF type:complete len:307 (-),score=48.28 TRINITY_DN39135_c0_g1_i2:133-1053(-)